MLQNNSPINLRRGVLEWKGTWEPKFHYSVYKFSVIVKKEKEKQRNESFVTYSFSFCLIPTIVLQQSNPHD